MHALVQKTSREQFEFVIILLALTILLTSGSSGYSTEETPADVYGYVYRAGSLQPIEDALVVTDHGYYATSTDSSGYYNLTLPPGDYVIEAVVANYSDSSCFVIVGDRDVRQDFYLLPMDGPRFSINGSVLDKKSGSLITVASVVIPSIGYSSIGGGTFSFTLPSGTYEFQVSGEGYVNATVNMTITDSDVTKNIYLTRLSTGNSTPADRWWIVVTVAAAGAGVILMAAVLLSRPRKSR